MADEPLSQAELETLFRVAQSKASGPAAAFMNASSVKAEVVPPSDFKRPQRADKAQLRALAILHEAFARGFTDALGGLLRTAVGAKLRAVDEITYGEFHARLDDPGCLNVLRASPLPGQLILVIDRAVLYPMLDRMLGGGREPSIVVNRPLTQIELRLTSRITALFIDQLSTAWQGVVDLKPAVERVESSPRAVRVVPDDDVVVVVRFEIALGETRGEMSLCIPAIALPPTDLSLASNVRKDAGKDSVELVAHLADTKITPADLANLQVGDIIATDEDAQSAVTLLVDGAVGFHGRAGAVKGRKAVRIEAVDQPPTRDTLRG